MKFNFFKTLNTMAENIKNKKAKQISFYTLILMSPDENEKLR